MKRRTWRFLLVGGAFVIGALVWAWRTFVPPVLGVWPREELILSPVTIVNPGHGRRANQTLIVRGTEIASISDEPPPGVLPRLTRHLAARYVLPGLIDMHVHFPPDISGARGQFAALLLGAGITTACNIGDIDGTIPDWRRKVRAGEAAGPRTFICGRVLRGDPRPWPYTIAMREPASPSAVMAAMGAAQLDCVLLDPAFSGRALRDLHAAAQQHHLPALAQVPASRNDDPAGLEDLADAAVASGMPFVPTMLVWDRLARLPEELRAPPPSVFTLPRFFRDLLWMPGAGLEVLSVQWGVGDSWVPPIGTDGIDRVVGDSAAAALAGRVLQENVRYLHAAGARVLPGSDTPNPFVAPGASMYEALQYLTEAGFTLDEAWDATTRQPGEALGVPLLGTVQVGAPADLLLFRDDPTRDIRALGTLEGVVADGRFYHRRILEDAVLKYYEFTRRPAAEWLSMTLARRRVAQAAAPRGDAAQPAGARRHGP